MSIGNVTQAVNLENAGLTLVLGHNVDLGGDGSKNGVGKSSLINAISYALYGSALSNIKKDNLINKSNSKHMLVTIEFEINNINYRIERGRRPAVLKFIVNDVAQKIEEVDEGQGEARRTQEEINRVLGINLDIFKHIIALNTNNEPFLSLKANDQREIIEHLFGITMLSEKANTLKDRIRVTKDDILEEDYRIKGIETANQQINKSIQSMKIRQTAWKKKNQAENRKLKNEILELEALDIEKEISLHKEVEIYRKSQSEKYEFTKVISSKLSEIKNETKKLEKAKKDLEKAENMKCYACGQSIMDEAHTKIKNEKSKLVEETKNLIEKEESTIKKLEIELDKVEDIGPEPKTTYKTIDEAYNHKTLLDSLKNSLKNNEIEEDPYIDQIKELEEKGIQPIEFETMNNLHKLKEHQEFLLKLLTNKDSVVRKKVIEQNLQYLNTRLRFYLDKLGLPHEVQFMNDLNVKITELGRDLDFDNLSRGERNRLVIGLKS